MMKSLINKMLKKRGYQISKLSTPEYKISYSQCGEDLIIRYIFILRGIDKPTYIDVGANDPFFLSNTAIFYKNGSRGINIEANPFLIDKFKSYRGEDINLNLGVGPNEAELDFYIIDDPTLSTFSKDEMERITSTGKYSLKETIRVQLTSLENILNDFWNGEFPDFLSLDVEGLDFEILQSIDFSKHWPKVICVEAAEYSPRGDGQRKDFLIDFLKQKGYLEYANTNLNAIMVKEEFWNT